MAIRVRQFLYQLQTRWRIACGFCPVCNSDAPELDTCWLCKGSREYPLTPQRKAFYREEMRLEMKAWKGLE